MTAAAATVRGVSGRRQCASGEGTMFEATIGRRSILTMAASLALPVPKEDYLVFDVYRNGSRIGWQHVRFRQAGDWLRVDSRVALHVALLDVHVFHYHAHIVEHWRSNTFRSARSAVNDDGTKIDLSVERVSDGIAVSGNHCHRYIAPPDALPLTYWNKAMLDGPMINMQTGHADTPKITKEGWFRLPAEPSGAVTAMEYRLTGPLHFVVYYNRANIWSGLAFHHDGHITYRPVLD